MPTREEELRARLDAMPRGAAGWKEFEDVGTAVLPSYVGHIARYPDTRVMDNR